MSGSPARRAIKLRWLRTIRWDSFGFWKDCYWFTADGRTTGCVNFCDIFSTKTSRSHFVTFGSDSSAVSALRYNSLAERFERYVYK